MMTTNYEKASITVLVTLLCMVVAIGPLNSNYPQFADAQKGHHGHYGKSYRTGGFSNVQIIHCVSDATANGGNSHGGTGGNSNGGNGGSSNGGTGGTGGTGGSNGGNGGPGGTSSGGAGGTSAGGASHGGDGSASSAITCSSS